MKWFRVYHDVLTDRKLTRVARVTRQERVTILGVWIALLTIASESTERGLLLFGGEAMDTQDIAIELNLEHGLLVQILDAMQAVEMLEKQAEVWTIINWDKRQFSSDDITARTRKFKQRKRSRNVSAKSGERSQNVAGTATDNRQTDNREQSTENRKTDKQNPDDKIQTTDVCLSADFSDLTPHLQRLGYRGHSQISELEQAWTSEPERVGWWVAKLATDPPPNIHKPAAFLLQCVVRQRAPIPGDHNGHEEQLIPVWDGSAWVYQNQEGTS